MELEEAIERLNLKAITSSAEAPDYPNCIVMKKDLITIFNHLAKQEKMIDLMIQWVDDRDYTAEFCESKTECDEHCRSCIKQYFEKKAEEAE